MVNAYVIADIGACHDNDVVKMSEAIFAAKRAGCDAIKFQWTSHPALMASRRGSALADGYATIYARYLAWEKYLHRDLAARCAETGIDYMCTVFLPSDVAVVAPLVSRFKVASFESLDGAMLSAHSGYGKQLIIGTGMADDVTLARALDVHSWPNRTRERLAQYGSLLGEIKLLQCVSAYPAPLSDLNLSLLWKSEIYGDSDVIVEFDGLSDHTDPSETLTGALAVAAGATIVEAHLRLPNTDPKNPDYAHAMTPPQFAEYVRLIRLAERCLGDGKKRARESEAPMLRYRVQPAN